MKDFLTESDRIQPLITILNSYKNLQKMGGKKMLKKLILKYGNAIASLSLSVAFAISNGSCRFILHQPEEPVELLTCKKQKCGEK